MAVMPIGNWSKAHQTAVAKRKGAPTADNESL